MTRKAWLFIGACTFAFAAAADTPPPKSSPRKPGATRQSAELDIFRNATRTRSFNGRECNAPQDGSCTVKVSITPSCVFTFDAEVLKIPRKGNVVIGWELTGNWKFAASKGIEFYDPGNDVHSPRRIDDKHFAWKNKATRKGYYGYEINVESTDGKTRCSKDPGVWNDFPAEPLATDKR